jgi:WD40 repeat protein
MANEIVGNFESAHHLREQYSGNGRFLTGCGLLSTKKISIFDHHEKKVVATFPSPIRWAWGISYLPKSGFVAVGGTKHVEKKREKFVIGGNQSDEDHLKVFEAETWLFILEAASGKEVYSERLGLGDTRDVVASDDEKKIVVGDSFGSVHVFEIEKGAKFEVSKLKHMASLQSEVEVVNRVLFSKDGTKLIVASGGPILFGKREGIIEIWDIKTAKRLSKFEIEADSPLTLCLTPDESKLLVSTYKDDCYCLTIQKKK